MGTEFSACKTGMDRMNVTSVLQSLCLQRELLLQSRNSSVYQHAQKFVGQTRCFFVFFFFCKLRRVLT